MKLIDDADFKKSHLAARLNGYVYGQGAMKQFNEEVEKLGLSEDVADFVRTLIIKNEGQGLTCWVDSTPMRFDEDIKLNKIPLNTSVFVWNINYFNFVNYSVSTSI